MPHPNLYDIAFKRFTHWRPHDLLSLLGIKGNSLEVLSAQPVEFSRDQRRLDMLLHVKVDGEDWLFFVEFQYDWRSIQPWRSLEYVVGYYLQHPDAPRKFEAICLVMHGSSGATSALDAGGTNTRLSFIFKIICLNAMSAAEAVRGAPPGWLVFTGLMAGADRDLLLAARSRILKELPEESRGDLVGLLMTFALAKFDAGLWISREARDFLALAAAFVNNSIGGRLEGLAHDRGTGPCRRALSRSGASSTGVKGLGRPRWPTRRRQSPELSAATSAKSPST